MKIYVASSWRNEFQPEVVQALRDAGHEVYDFRNPGEGDNGFAWSEIDPDWQEWTPEAFRGHLNHSLARQGFFKDMDALRDCEVCVLVQPCGISAHLELGWAEGAGKATAVILKQGEPELMYKMVDLICLSIDEVVAALACVPEKGE
jgi:hypothetical protein